MSLSDSCIEQVYRQTSMEEQEMVNCIHNAGGIGAQIDNKNALLKEEMHRFSNLNVDLSNGTSSHQLPYLAINGNQLYNATNLSDWQLLAAVCTTFSQPKPAICDFCLLECPKGNEDHDPTRQELYNPTQLLISLSDLGQ